MPNKLTQEEYSKKVLEKYGDNFTIISEYKGVNYPITLKCNKHNLEITRTARSFIRGAYKLQCPKCYEENRREKHSEQYVKCAYCGKEKYVDKCVMKKNTTNLYFCSIEHMKLAQKEAYKNPKFKALLPKSVRENGYKDYRKYALYNYPHKCAVCGYEEDIDLLEIHHIDENHSNNNLNNLIVLCPLCHKKISTHKYKLVDRKYLQKI